MARKPQSYFAALALMAACSLPTPATAQSGIWVTSTAGNFNWSQPGNWLDGVVADGADNTADFATAGLAGPMTISLDNPRTIGALVFDNPSNTFGWTISGSNALTLSSNAGGGPIIAVNYPQILATLAIPLTGTQGFTATGPGTLVLSGTNSYSGGTNVLNGTVQVAADTALGTGNVTGASLGMVNFTGTTTTAKSFAMNGGTVSVAAGQTVTFNGSVVSNAFFDGAGTFATSATSGAQFVNVAATQSVSISSSSASDKYVHFNNSGSLIVAQGVGTGGTPPFAATFSGFTNQGTGTVTIDLPVSPTPIETGAFVNVSNFQSYGTLVLYPAVYSILNQYTLLTNVGTTPLAFNAGSRTFIDPAASQMNENAPHLAGIDVHGQNLVITGGLFVNNGFVDDSSNGSPGTIVVDYGALLKGAGYFGVPIITQNGGRVQAGDSPGSASFGRFVFGPGGVSNYAFTIDDATGTAGAVSRPDGQASGWGLARAVKQSLGTTTSSGDFIWTGTPANRVTVALDTIVNSPDVDSDALAPMANFDPSKSYAWPAVEWAGTYSGPTDAAMLDASTSFDTSGFLNPFAGTFGWSLDLPDQTLSLIYTPSSVPEPGTLTLVGLATALAGWKRRRGAVSAITMLAAIGFLPTPARAQSGIWITNTAGTYNWSQAGNWLDGVIADGADNTADFTTAGLTGPMTINLDTPRTIGALVFDNPSNSFGWTISGGNALTLSSSAGGGPTIVVNNPQITATLAIPLAGSQGFTATGPGTLVLSGTNSYSGGTNVLNGTVQVAADAALGTGNVTGASLGTVNFTGTTTTAKSFAMNGGSVSVAAGQTVTFNGSVVSSAFLDGAGTFATSSTAGAQFVNVTATASVSVTSNYFTDQFVHFTNSGNLSVAPGINVNGTSSTVNFNGLTNEGLGTITIGAASQINVANFQSYGVLNLTATEVGSNLYTLITNVGSSPLSFDAGSRTMFGPPGPGMGPPIFVCGFNLNGQNLLLDGALFVNNSFVGDFSSGNPGTIIVDYGSLYKGRGFTGPPLITQNGGRVQSGASPGSASYGQFVFGPGGVSNYVFTIDDATGTAGAAPRPGGQASGWGLARAVKQSLGTTTSSGDFIWTGTPANRVTVALDTIVNSPDVDSDALAPMANFDPTTSYVWRAVEWAGTYSGPTDAAMLDASTSFDTSGFLNPFAGTFGWSIDLPDQTLSLTYTPSSVPEPGTLLLVGLAAGLAGWTRRRGAVSAIMMLATIGFLPAPAVAQSGAWVTNTAGTFNWSQAGNWLDGVIADGADNTADFATVGLTGPVTINLDTPRTIGALVFDNPSNSFGWTISGSNALTLSSSAGGGPTIAVNNPQITATLAIPLTGTQGFTATGPGALVLSGTNSYSGGTNVLNGTVQVAADAALGTGNVTGASLGTVNFTGTTTTAKSFAMNGGTVSVATGQTVTLNGGLVSNAFLDGAGTFATSATSGAQFVNVAATQSVKINSNSATDQYVHFTNSGALNIPAGIGSEDPMTGAITSAVTFNDFTNQGTGAVTIGPVSKVNVSNFQSYGTLLIEAATVGSGQTSLVTNVGTAPISFNAGSRTFVSTFMEQTMPTFVAGMDLDGKNAIIAGGLFVNDGFVVDFSDGGLSSGAVFVADYGALVKGNGFFGVQVVTQNGGKFQSGNSPGATSFGRFVFGPGGVNNYIFNIDDATGRPGAAPTSNGPSSGWGLVKAIRQSVLGSTTSPGDFVWTATPANKLTVALDTIVNSPDVDSDALAPMANFDPTRFYAWPAVEWAGTYSGPTDAAMLDASTSFDTSGFLNPIAGTFGWSLDLPDQTLSLTYTPSSVPEPGTLTLVGLAAALGGWRRRRRGVRRLPRSGQTNRHAAEQRTSTSCSA